MDVLKAVYGSDNVTGSFSEGLVVRANNEPLEASIWVIETMLTGNISKRVVIPNAVLTGLEDITYLSVGSVSDERSYYKSLEKHTLRKLDEWEHEKYLDVCAADVQKWIASRAKEIKAQGFDGWWLDNVDVYEEYKSTETYKAMGAILSSVKALGGYVMVNGGMEYLQKAMNADSGHKGLGSVDGVTQEEVFSMITDYGDGEKDKGKFGTQTSKQSSEYQSHLKRVIRHKMQAFLLEYTTDNTLKLRISAYCKTTGAMACISSDVNL